MGFRVELGDEKRRFGTRLIDVPLAAGLGTIESLSSELEGYVDVLLGRVTPPIDNGVMTLMEVADAYYARAAEIEMNIYRLEREGGIIRGSPYYRFRTGELRTFLELSRKAAEKGSRRITYEQFLYAQLRDAGELTH